MGGGATYNLANVRRVLWMEAVHEDGTFEAKLEGDLERPDTQVMCRVDPAYREFLNGLQAGTRRLALLAEHPDESGAWPVDIFIEIGTAT